MTTLYLCGRMTGIADLNRPVFHEAEQALIAAGYKVINPHGIQIGYEDQSWGACMRRDIKAMIDCDGVALISSDWKNSKGCAIELALAQALGIKTNYLAAWLHVSSAANTA
jgi:hypothetical protein